MDEKTDVVEPVSATTADLKLAFPNSDAAFREECTELGATLAEAHELWATNVTKATTKLAEANKAQADKIAELEAAAKAKEEAPGVEALGVITEGTTNAAGGDVSEQWHAAVAEKEKAGMKKGPAMVAVVKEQPELHQAYLDTYNTEHRQQRRRIT